MNVIDSCGWLEFFGEGPNSEFFADALSDPEALLVPSVSIYEVFKRVLLQRGEGKALEAVAHMEHGRVINLDTKTAITAARLSTEHALPMADAIMLATAQVNDAIFWTQDSHFADIDGVRYAAIAAG